MTEATQSLVTVSREQLMKQLEALHKKYPTMKMSSSDYWTGKSDKQLYWFLRSKGMMVESTDSRHAFVLFDQDQSSPWRKEARAGHYETAARLIDDWISSNEIHDRNDMSILVWHAGQMYAFAGQTDKAISRMRKSFNADEPWNLYVKGTIAFLRGDQQGLEAIINTGKVGEQNLKVLKDLAENPSKSYKDVY